jgi:hypothetical protein
MYTTNSNSKNYHCLVFFCFLFFIFYCLKILQLVATGESEPRLSICKGQVRVAGGVPRLAAVGANLFYLSETPKVRHIFCEKVFGYRPTDYPPFKVNSTKN